MVGTSRLIHKKFFFFKLTEMNSFINTAFTFLTKIPKALGGKTYLQDGEEFPAIVHMILAFVVKKEPENNTRSKLTKHVHDQTHGQRQQHLPVIRIAFLLVHDYRFEHGAFTHHKLYHPVDEE